MRKILALILTLGLTTGGCAWFGGSSSTDEEIKPAQPQEQTAAPEPTPAPVAPAKDAKGKKGKTKAEKAQAKAEKKAAMQQKNDNGKAVKPCAASESAAVSGRPNIDFDHFKALDMRVGTVLVAEKHPNADRILRLEIDFGEGQPRQILSGLAEHYTPEAMVGKRVCAVLNLEPRKIRGLMSHGMVLTAGDGSSLTLLGLDGTVSDGSEIA